MEEKTMLDAMGISTSSGCFLSVAFVVTFGLFVAFGTYMQNVRGWDPSGSLAVGLIVATLTVIGIKRKSRLVFRIAGAFLIVSGLGFAGFILFDFVKSLFTGHSVWAGDNFSRAQGISTALVMGFGVTAAGIGWGMIQQASK